MGFSVICLVLSLRGRETVTICGAFHLRGDETGGEKDTHK